MGPKKDMKDFNPFPGLRPFAPGDRDLFFGRDTESDEVILKLLKNRYVTIIGASGNGKSSLVYSSVLPKLLDLKKRESSVWKIISFRPGYDPFGNMARAMSEGITDQGQNKIGSDIILSELLDTRVSFSEVVRKYVIKHDDKVVLIIDQFEELFRYSSLGKSEISYATAGKFVEFLLTSIIKPGENIFMIFTMRSEYLGECSHFQGLTTLVNNSNYFVPDMGSDNFREAIEGPINFAGAKIDQALVDAILNDLKEKTGQLSQFQHAMMRTWGRWKELDEPGRPVSKEDYNSIGTIRNAVSLHADELYEQLSPRGKKICSVLFKTITRKGADNKGVRHPSDFETIKSIAKCSDEELSDVIEKFSDRSTAFIITDININLTDTSIIDLQNECIINSWDRLKSWIDEENSSMQIYQRLSDASALYQQGKTGLFKAPDLQLAISWREQQKPTLAWAVQYNPAFERAMVYLRTSERAYVEEEQNKIRIQNRKTKKSRLVTRILGIFALVVLGIMLFEYAQKIHAERQISLAEKDKNQAFREKAIADSFAVVVFKSKIISDSTTSVAVKDAVEAKEQRIIADVQKSYAERNAQEALRQKSLAEGQRDKAQRLRMLSVGKSMSLRSLEMNGEKDIQSLLAYQAYLFYKRNNGSDNDADIYAGLYNVALQYGNINYRFFKGHGGDIKSIVFIPGESKFFTSGNDGKVLKWSLEKKDKTVQVIYSGNDIIDVLAVSPDASWLACGSSNSSIRMIPLKGNDIGYEMHGHKGGIKSLIFSYDGKYLYSAALDGKVLKWDIAARTSINVSTGSVEISSIDISSNGNYIAGIRTDGNVIVWDPNSNQNNFSIETGGKNIKVVKFNPDNNLLAIGDADGNVELWDIYLHKKLSSVKAHGAEVNDIQFNTTLKQMATSGKDKKLKIFSIKDPADLSEPPVTFTDNEGFVMAIRFSPNGQVIISGESGEGNITERPAHVDYLVQNICKLISRNMTQEEWNAYVGKDIPLEKTCLDSNFNIKIEQTRALNKGD